MSDTSDVAKQALEMAKQGVGELYSKFQQVAPQVWQMARRQKVIDGIECMALAAICVAVFFWSCRQVPKWKAAHEDDDAFPWPQTLAVVAFIAFMPLFVNGVDLIFNPDYWTLKTILELAGTLR